MIYIVIGILEYFKFIIIYYIILYYFIYIYISCKYDNILLYCYLYVFMIGKI